ncbi:auxin efflux carrier [Linnemannia elongata AG-77]|uniref:Auxin efflux carrier n=1 Tax=Linnemannia elongata AG-77 TaxID=1314771 RepID=A0A197K987_9FUNG|nr:auxin efflux carrier [Linnemannia elongata AG-77]
MAAEWSVLLLAGGEAVSTLNLYFLTPCLLFTKMASTITWDQFKSFYPIPIFYLFFSLTSWTIAKLGSRFLGFSRDEEKFVIASVFFSNTNSLPMALVQSLAMSGAGGRLLRDEGDDRQLVAARGMSYILFYAIFGNLVRWSYGFSLLVPRDRPEEKEVEGEEKGVDVYVEAREDLRHEVPTREGEVRIDMDNHNSNNPQTRHNQNPSISLAPSLSSNQPPTLLQKSKVVFDKISQLLTPPLLTALVALVVGLVPALHHFFMSHESKFYAFVVRPLEECGAGAIPLILLCLGAQVVHLASSSSSISPVGYAILARNILAPLICLPAILFHPTSLSPTLTQDPVFKMVLVLVAGAPTAINLTQLCQIKGFFEREMATMLFWSYCVLGVPLVLGWALVGLWASGR